MTEAYVCDAVRTPIGRYGGAPASVRPDDLAALTVAALLRRNPALDPAAIDEVVLGCANQAGEDNRNVARRIDVPRSVCHAEGRAREDQDRFALRSQQRAAAAYERGFFSGELMALEVPRAQGAPIAVIRDEHPRQTSLEQLAKLSAPFRTNGTVTAGNSSGVNASQALAVLRELGLRDDAQHINSNGGAIALGHPLGMSERRSQQPQYLNYMQSVAATRFARCALA